MATSFTAAMSRYFGRKHGQSLADFGNELKALTQADREWFRVELARELGEEIDPISKAA